jgi:carbohydrate-selective porin OprB
MTTIRFSRLHAPALSSLAASILSLASLSHLHAGPAPDTSSNGPVTAPATSCNWWSGKYASGNWFGLRNSLEDRGVDLYGSWIGTFYGFTGGGVDTPHGAFDEQITLGLKLDFGKLAGVEGLTAQGSVRWRDGRNPNDYAGASSTFNPSKYQSGQQWRLMPFFLTYTTPELLGVKNLLTISGGWQDPYDFFLEQPDSKLFINNAIASSKGIGGLNGFGWGSSYATWGGFIKVKPVDWQYTMAGLYVAIPEASAMSNHGLDLAGYRPNPNLNGLYFLAETGVTPKLGAAKLPGKYAFGGIYWGVENKSFNGQTYDGKYDLYWQADQMVYRAPSREAEPAPLAKGPTDGKSFKEVNEPAAKQELSDKGLYLFSLINYAPAYDNAMPFYLQAGFVYKGLIPSRDKDQLGIVFGFGNYSYDKIEAQENAGQTVRRTNEGVVEIDYRAQLSKFLYVQPFWQYIIRPDGTGMVNNANLFGMNMGVTF